MYVLTKTKVIKSLDKFSESVSVDTEIKYVSVDIKEIKERFTDVRSFDDDFNCDCINEYHRNNTTDKLVESVTHYCDCDDVHKYCQLDIHEV